MSFNVGDRVNNPRGGVLLVEVTDNCPYCRAKVAVARDVESREPALLHDMPFCDEFENMPPDEYVRQIRLKNHTS